MSYITGMVTTRVDASTDQQWALGTIGQDSSGYLYKYVKYDKKFYDKWMGDFKIIIKVRMVRF